MMRFDHLAIPVSDVGRSRDWYVSQLGLAVEFEVAERRLIALQDSEGFAIFLQEAAVPVQPGGCALWFQVEDVEVTFAAWSARGIAFAHDPQKSYWGYGAELVDSARQSGPPVGRTVDEGEVSPAERAQSPTPSGPIC